MSKPPLDWDYWVKYYNHPIWFVRKWRQAKLRLVMNEVISVQPMSVLPPKDDK